MSGSPPCRLSVYHAENVNDDCAMMTIMSQEVEAQHYDCRQGNETASDDGTGGNHENDHASENGALEVPNETSNNHCRAPAHNPGGDDFHANDCVLLRSDHVSEFVERVE